MTISSQLKIIKACPCLQAKRDRRCNIYGMHDAITHDDWLIKQTQRTPVIVNTTLKYALNFPNKQNEFNEWLYR